MDHLVSYIESNVAELVADILPNLREADPVFRETRQDALLSSLIDVFGHLNQYMIDRDVVRLDDIYDAFRALWPPDQLYQSAVVRCLFAFGDLLAIRARADYHDADDFIDDLRIFRTAMREALCSVADRLQGRYGSVNESGVTTAEITAGRTDTDAPGPVSAPGGQISLTDRLEAARPIARDGELRQLWSKLRAVAGGERGGHQVFGIKAPPGYGKSTLVSSFIDRVEHHIGQSPVSLRAQAPRLFNIPLWPFALLLRDAFRAPPGVEGNPNRVEAALEELAVFRATASPAEATRLRVAAPFLLRLIGEEPEEDPEDRLSPRTVGVRVRQGLTSFLEAFAFRTRVDTGAPLFLVIEDADSMDSPSWSLLRHLIQHVSAEAPLMVVLTYGERFSPPADLARMAGFNEITLPAFDPRQGLQLIDTLLSPNRFEEATRVRLNAGAKGSPMLLYESVRQLVADGVFGLEGGRWVEVTPLPEGVIGDLASIVARRRQRLEPTAAEVLEVVAVVEDTTGGTVLSEVAARRAIGRDELMVGLENLRRAGLVEVIVDEGGINARTRHPLVRDEIYRQMGQDRRRAIHEDAGEVFLKMRGTAGFPSLAASHLALAGWPTRALHGLIEGVDRCLAMNSLDGALDLCSQGLGLLKGLARDEHDHFLYQILLRRERVHAMFGHLELREADMAQIENLTPKASRGPGGTVLDAAALSFRRAALELTAGRHGAAEELLIEAMQADGPETAAGCRARLALALNCWQRGQHAEARLFLDDAMSAIDVQSQGRRARLLYTKGVFDGSEGRLQEALHNLFEAWRVQRASGDLFGEALVVQGLGGVFWAGGRLLDALRLLRRADRLLREAGESLARIQVRLHLAALHTQIGDFDEAEQLYSYVARRSDRSRDRLVHASATVGLGRLLVNQGRFDEAMSLLAQCLKELGRKAMNEPVYVDALVALAMNFVFLARGEKLVVGGLRYAKEAADRAAEINYPEGLLRALVIQTRGALILGRSEEANQRLGALDSALNAALVTDPRLERLRHEVELARFKACTADGDKAGASAALNLAWAELEAQVAGLAGSGYEEGFMNNIYQHREVVAAWKQAHSGA